MHQRAQPLFLLRQRAVAMENFHIAGIGRRAVEALARPADLAHFLGAQRIFEIGKLRTFEHEAVVDMRLARMWRHEEIPQAGFLGLVLHLFDYRDHLPAIALVMLFVELGLSGPDILVDERPHAVPEIAFAFAECEVHRRSPNLLLHGSLDRTAFSVKRLRASKCPYSQSARKGLFLLKDAVTVSPWRP